MPNREWLPVLEFAVQRSSLASCQTIIKASSPPYFLLPVQENASHSGYFRYHSFRTNYRRRSLTQICEASPCRRPCARIKVRNRQKSPPIASTNEQRPTEIVKSSKVLLSDRKHPPKCRHSQPPLCFSPPCSSPLSRNTEALAPHQPQPLPLPLPRPPQRPARHPPTLFKPAQMDSSSRQTPSPLPWATSSSSTSPEAVSTTSWRGLSRSHARTMVASSPATRPRATSSK